MAEYKRHLKTSFLIALEEAAGSRNLMAAMTRMRRWADDELRDKRRKVDEETRVKIEEWLSKERTPVWIARETGLSEPTIRNIARERRLRRPKKIKKI